MALYIIISIISGILFGIMDGIINANPIARKLYEVYKPLAKPSINFIAGVVIDLAYGFIMGGVFLIIYNSLPGGSGVIKGISFAVGLWFFRVVMYVASQWMMYKVSLRTLLYTLVTGFVEMLILGILFGLTLKPW